MDDPSFDAGITTDSTVRMIHDISEAYAGRKDKVHLPLPVGSAGPPQHVRIAEDGSLYPGSLKIRRSAPATNHVSRRIQAYKTYHSIDIGTPPLDAPNIEPRTDCGVAVDVDAMIEKYGKLSRGDDRYDSDGGNDTVVRFDEASIDEHVSQPSEPELVEAPSVPKSRSRRTMKPRQHTIS